MLKASELFSNDRILENRMQGAKREVLNLSENIITDSIEQQVVNNIVNAYKVDPIFLDIDNKESKPINENYIEMCIPFEGTPELFLYEPHLRYHSLTPEGVVDGSTIRIKIDIRDKSISKGSVISDVKKIIDSINEWVDPVNNDVHSFNENLKKTVQKDIQDRKQRIEYKNSVVNSLNDL